MTDALCHNWCLIIELPSRGEAEIPGYVKQTPYLEETKMPRFRVPSGPVRAALSLKLHVRSNFGGLNLLFMWYKVDSFIVRLIYYRPFPQLSSAVDEEII